MASSTIVTDLTIHTAHIRLRSGKYMLVYYTNEYDEDGNPINITIYDSSETLIENPPYEIVYEVTKTIPPPEGDWLNNLWFKNGVNSLSPRQSPGQTNNIFLGFETAENFDLTDLVTYSGDYNFIAGYQLAPSLTTGSNNVLFGKNIVNNLSNTSYNFISGQNIANSGSNIVGNFMQGNNIAANSTIFTYNYLNGRELLTNSTDIRTSFINGQSIARANSGTLWYSFFNGENLFDNANSLTYMFVNGVSLGGGVTSGTGSQVLGFFNLRNGGTASVNYSTVMGRELFDNATGLVNYSQNFGYRNATNVIGSGFSFLAGFQNLYNSTSDIQTVIAIGRENGFLLTGDHDNSIYLGYRNAYAGSGNYNNYQGYESGYYQTGNYNIGFGYRVLYGQSGLSTGSYNVALGEQALKNNTTGNNNVGQGAGSLFNNTTGNNNLGLGYRSFYTNSTGTGNVGIGRESGYLNTGNYNVFIGYQAGYNETGSNKLYIENSNISTPLIYGEFDNDWIRINGYLEVRDKTGITTGNVVVWDGDKLVDSGTAIGSLGGDPDQTLTWTNTSTTVRNLTISGTGNTVELDGLAVEMALDDIVLNTSWRYQALDVNGVVLGAPLIIQEGTDINIVRSGNTLIFNSTAGGGDPDQTISYTESTKTLLLSGSLSSVQLDGLVDDTSWSGTSGTITYSLLDVDDTLVGAPLIFNAGTDIGIVRSGNTLTFSYTGSGASLWTDAGTYYRPNNLSNLASNSFRIYDTGRVTIGGTSDPTPYLLSVNGIGRFTSGVSLNGDLEFTNSSDIVFDSGGSGNIVDTNGVSGSSGKFLSHDGGGVAWVDAPGYTPTYATSTGNADTFTTGTYVNINGASTTYTIPVTEVLAIWCSVIILGGSSGANVTVSIRKNSSIILISRTIFVEAGVEKNISLHSNDDFNSGDTLRIHCSTSGSGFETVSTNTTWITVT